MKSKIVYMVVDHEREVFSSQIIDAFDNKEMAQARLDQYVSKYYTTPLHENPTTLLQFQENLYRSGRHVTIETCVMFEKEN
jgi:hypothetical protein